MTPLEALQATIHEHALIAPDQPITLSQLDKLLRIAAIRHDVAADVADREFRTRLAASRLADGHDT